MPAITASRERGQAAVELVALLPLIVVLAIGGVQVAVTLHTWSAAHEAARAAARADLVGASATDAARRSLVGASAAGMWVHATTRPDGTHRVRVRLPVPRLAPWIPVPPVESRVDLAP